MNIVRTGVRSVKNRSWTFLIVKLQHFGDERVSLAPATHYLGGDQNIYASIGVRCRLLTSYTLASFVPRLLINAGEGGSGGGKVSQIKFAHALDIAVQRSLILAPLSLRLRCYCPGNMHQRYGRIARPMVKGEERLDRHTFFNTISFLASWFSKTDVTFAILTWPCRFCDCFFRCFYKANFKVRSMLNYLSFPTSFRAKNPPL